MSKVVTRDRGVSENKRAEKNLSVRMKRGVSDHRTGSRNLVDDFWFLDRRLVSTRTIFITTRDAQHCSYPSPSSKLASSLVYSVLCAPPRDILSTQSHHEGRRTQGPTSEQQRKCRHDKGPRDCGQATKRPVGISAEGGVCDLA